MIAIRISKLRSQEDERLRMAQAYIWSLRTWAREDENRMQGTSGPRTRARVATCAVAVEEVIESASW